MLTNSCCQNDQYGNRNKLIVHYMYYVVMLTASCTLSWPEGVHIAGDVGRYRAVSHGLWRPWLRSSQWNSQDLREFYASRDLRGGVHGHGASNSSVH